MSHNSIRYSILGFCVFTADIFDSLGGVGQGLLMWGEVGGEGIFFFWTVD